MTKSIKIYDGIVVLHNGKSKTYESFPDLWRAFGWDIENDPNAKECSLMIVRELICWGDMTLKDAKGYPLHLQLIRPEID